MDKVPSIIKFQRNLHSFSIEKTYQRIYGIVFNNFKSVLTYHHKCGYVVEPSLYCNMMHNDVNIDDFVVECKYVQVDYQDLKPGDWVFIDMFNVNATDKENIKEYKSSYCMYLGNNVFVYVNAVDSIIKMNMPLAKPFTCYLIQPVHETV